MSLNVSDLWAIRILALFFYGALLAFLVWNRYWSKQLELRLLLYMGLALISSMAFVASVGNWAIPEIGATLLRLYLYSQAALALFFYAAVLSFISEEHKPWSLIPGILLLGLLMGVDFFRASLDAGGLIGAPVLILVLRAAMWLVYTGLTITIIVRVYVQTYGALHRNRLSYAALAAGLIVIDGLFDLILGEPFRHIGVACQMFGVGVLTYAALHHELADLRTVIRRSIYLFIVSFFTVLIYFFAIVVVVALLSGWNNWQNLFGAAMAAVVLAFIYQPFHHWLQNGVERILFGRHYDAQSVVSEFSRRLSMRIDLDEFVAEGRTLIQRVMGVRDVVLLLVERDAQGFTLYPLPAHRDGPPSIRLDAVSSMAVALATRAVPLLQYDIDRLPLYNDIPSGTRAALSALQGEVYLPVKRGTLIGIWVIGSKTSGDRFNNEDLSLLTLLASQSGVALENARLLADLRMQMAEVRSMRDYLDSTMASIATGVMTLNQDGDIVSYNRAAEGIFRVPAVAAIGKPYVQVLPELEGAQLSLLLARLWAQSAQHLVRDAVGQVTGRGQVHLTLHLSAMRRGDEMVGVAMVIEDLTEQARLEQQRRMEEREKQRVRNTFERYVSSSVVDGLLAHPESVELGGVRHLITVLFADLHGFSGLSEKLPPEELVKILNGYLSLAAQTILHYEGTLDKFLGDGVMALFNAPLSQKDHALRATRAALALQREGAKFAEQLPESQRLTFRIGLHTGDAIVGNIGTHDLMNYTAVGDTVNIAKRLQENADIGQILISRNTFDLVSDSVVVQPKELLTVKGRITPIEIFELTSMREHDQ